MTDGKTVHPAPGARRAVIIGGSLAGMLAAAALHAHVDETWIVEADELPHGAKPRRGLPQADHVHLMWSGGANAAETVLPGIIDNWLLAGARRIPIPTGMVGLSTQGWFRRWGRETHFLIACSRDLLDSVVRDQVLSLPGVKVVHARAEGLAGTAQRVTGVHIRHAGSSREVLEADFVIDASGRGSRSPRYLEELGAGNCPQRTVDSGLVYATRIFRAPPGADDFPVVTIQADPRTAGPGQSASILPIEGERWLVTASGTRGGEPSGRNEDFEAFARQLRHPIIGELVSHLTPLTDVTISRSTRNQRRYFEKVRRWPDRFVVLGDAVAAFNPVYGHGMSVVAQGAVALGEMAAAHGLAEPGLARRIQRKVAKRVDAAWSLATGQDIFFPGVTGGAPNMADRLLARYVDRLLKTTTGSFTATRKFTDVSSLQAPLTTLVGPRLLLAAAVGPHLPPLSGPPLSQEERAVVTGHNDS
ncbi:FAD-dependent monooxygenase [Streptomyces sp. NPDC086783]|uniref:FAD-dependent monooxygenase n=1 Tax=Streptomyces sp. NPDC086783 TaxID=3365758 RepID=UPI0037F4FDA5